VVTTCRQQDRPVLDYLTRCCQALYRGTQPPSLLPQATSSLPKDGCCSPGERILEGEVIGAAVDVGVAPAVRVDDPILPELETDKPGGESEPQPGQRRAAQERRVHGKFVEPPHGLKVVLLYHVRSREVENVVEVQGRLVAQH